MMNKIIFFFRSPLRSRELWKDIKTTTIKREIYKAPEHSSLILKSTSSQQYLHFTVEAVSSTETFALRKRARLTSKQTHNKTRVSELGVIGRNASRSLMTSTPKDAGDVRGCPNCCSNVSRCWLCGEGHLAIRTQPKEPAVLHLWLLDLKLHNTISTE